MDTLEKVFDHMKNEVPDSDLAAFHGAYDHRKAELTMKKNFDKIPATAWKYVK
jgi:hemolysin expression modulating protein